MMLHLCRLATLIQGQAAAPDLQSGILANLQQAAPLVLMFGVVYFVMLRPANKQREAQRKLLSGLKKDDEVITSGGMFGRIASLDADTVSLEIADRVKIRMRRDQISGLAPQAMPPTTGSR